jgi:hypothetical protein
MRLLILAAAAVVFFGANAEAQKSSTQGPVVKSDRPLVAPPQNNRPTTTGQAPRMVPGGRSQNGAIGSATEGPNPDHVAPRQD